MGILNVTPDSFSDGGEYLDSSRAVDRALAMLEQGASIIDVGPESTRPGSRSVDAAEQIRRAIPVIEGIRRARPDTCISIDTRLAEVAAEAIRAGARIVNDVSALRDDPQMLGVVAGSDVSVVLMHMRGTPDTMQRGGGPEYDDVVREVGEFLLARREAALAGGIAGERIILDPGIGFGKRAEHNWQLLAAIDHFVQLGSSILIGASRKRFLGTSDGRDDPKSRVAGSVACAVVAAMKGAAIVRVHDVAETVEALQVVKAVSRPSGTKSSDHA